MAAGGKLAEIFTEVSLDVGKAMSGLSSFQAFTQKAADEISARLAEIKRASEFEVKLANVAGIQQAERVISGLAEKMATLRRESESLANLKQSTLLGLGFSGGTAAQFSNMQGMPPALGLQISESQRSGVASIDKRQLDLQKQSAELAQMQAAAESKLSQEIQQNTQSILAQARAEDTRRKVRLQLAAADEHYADMQRFAARVIDQTTTAEERQAVFLKNLNSAYQLGVVPVENYRRAMAFGNNVANFDQMAGGVRRFHFAIQQASFGVQDFLTVYGTMGLRGALQGSANNFAQVAAIINPLQGAFYGLGITLASVLIPSLIEAGSESTKTKEKVADLVEIINKLREAGDAEVRIRQAGNVSNITTGKQATEERARIDQRIEESQQRQRVLQETIRAAEALSKPQFVNKFKLSEEESLQVAGVISGAGAGEGGTPRTLQETLNDIARNRFGQGVTARMNEEDNTVVVERLRTIEQVEEAQKKILGLEVDLAKEGATILEQQNRLNELKEHEKQLRQDAISDIKEQLGITTDLEKTLKRIEDDRRKLLSQISEATEPGRERVGLMAAANRKAREETVAAHVEDAEKEAAKGDRANQDAARKREARERTVSKLTKDLENDNLDERSRRIKNIADTLEERRDQIFLNVRDPKEQGRLLGLAAGAAERDLASLKPRGGDFTSAQGLQSAIQKQLFGGDLAQSAKQTAANTKEMSDKLDTLIKNTKDLGIAKVGKG